MAIGSSAEIGRKFNTGAQGAWYEWVVDGQVVELGRGEWDLCYPSISRCVYPPPGHRYYVCSP
jgi:hypothetical protein